MKRRGQAKIWVALVLLAWLGLGSTMQAQEAAPIAEEWLSVDEQKHVALSNVLRASFSTVLVSLTAAIVTYALSFLNAFFILYFGSWVRRILDHALNTLACISPLILLLTVYSAFSTRGVILGVFLGIAIYPLIGRQLLARVSQRAHEFQFMQAKVLGHRALTVFRYYAWGRFLMLTLPNFFFGFIYALLVESMFSSLGLASGEGDTWGSLIYLGSEHLLDAPWHVFYPGYAIIITTLAAYVCIPLFDRLLSVPTAKYTT